jgi:hypothetical protein
MFGFGEKNKQPPVGAREKIRVAREMAAAGGNEVRAGQRGKGQDDTVPVMVAIYGIACAFSLMLMQFTWPKGPPFHLADPALDRLLLQMPPPSFVGDKDMNLLVAMFIRGFVFFLLAGVTPGLVKLAALVFRRGKGAQIWMFWMMLSFLLTGAAVLHNM